MRRDPVVDLVRAVAVVGVIAGHWLVTAIVATPRGLVVDSPLRWSPDLTPLSWVLQTLGLFFFAGGFAAARSRTGWWRRVWALAVPVALVLACWALTLTGLVARGLPTDTASLVVHLVTSPLWFLGVYLLLQALMPVASRLDRTCGAWAVLPLAALAIVAEIGGFAEINVLVVWWVPWQLGIVVARRGFERVWGLPLLALGIAGYAVAVTLAGYPASAVGGTADRSNLAPPSPAALSLALAQVGLVLALEPLARRVRSRVLDWINTHALALFLVHQSAMLTVTLAATAAGPVPGLHTSPADPSWPLVRLLWLPVFAIALLVWVFALRGRLPSWPRRDLESRT